MELQFVKHKFIFLTKLHLIIPKNRISDIKLLVEPVKANSIYYHTKKSMHLDTIVQKSKCLSLIEYICSKLSYFPCIFFLSFVNFHCITHNTFTKSCLNVLESNH